MERLKEADSDEEKREAEAYCDAQQSTEGPYASRQTNERVTLDQGLAWWPYRPVVRADTSGLPRSGAREAIFALGRRTADPRSEPSALMLVYQYEPATVDNSGLYEILKGGGITLQHTHFAKGKVRGEYPGTKEPVTVNGHPAVLTEMRRPTFNVDWRVIVWQEPSPDGGVLYWDVGFHPDRYSKDESLRIANGLVEIR